MWNETSTSDKLFLDLTWLQINIVSCKGFKMVSKAKP